MSRPRPEPHVEYAAEGPTPEFRASSRREAVRSLAASWGVSELRAADLLANPSEYVEECRARQRLTGREAMRQLERRYAPRVQQ